MATALVAGCGTSGPSFQMPVVAEKPAAETPPPARIAAYSRSALGQAKETPAPGIGNGRGVFVEVQQGETILDISRRTKVPVSLLMSENKLPDLRVLPGQQLFIPKY